MIKRIFLTWIVVTVVSELLLFAFLLVFVKPSVGESILRISIGAFAYLNAVFGPAFGIVIFVVSLISNVVAMWGQKRRDFG